MKSLILFLCLIHLSYSRDSLHFRHRRLSQRGQLNLTIEGPGYFQYRLRVKIAVDKNDVSQKAHKTYDGAYSSSNVRIHDISLITDDNGNNLGYDVTMGEEGFAEIPISGEWLKIDNAKDKICPPDIAGLRRVNNLQITTRHYVTLDFFPTTESINSLKNYVTSNFPETLCIIRRASDADAPHGNNKDGVGLPDGQGLENDDDGDDEHISQVVYNKDGSLHVNKYGYLCDDNGYLLVSAGRGVGNAKHHIHIPSRADKIIVTPTGKIMAIELGGGAITKVGQLKLARFENPQGLNIRLKMKSNCNAANEEGFALGNWCAGTALDGKEHTYLTETSVSGPGILGSPGHQGFGMINQ